MTAKSIQSRTRRLKKAKASRQVEKCRSEYVKGVIAIVLSGGALPYFVKDSVLKAIKTGKETLKERGDMGAWAKEHLNEIILGLELAKYTLQHLEGIVTEEDELKALRPHILEWLEEQGCSPDPLAVRLHIHPSG